MKIYKIGLKVHNYEKITKKDIQNYADDSVSIIIVGNKLDLVNEA